MFEEKELETLDTRDFDAEIEEILQLLEEKKYSRLRSILLENNAVDIAEILENINDEMGLDKAILVFRMLPKDVSVEVFAYLPEDEQVAVIKGITQREIDHIIEELAFDDMIDLLEELPANLVDKILVNTTKEERKLINTFLNYPENSAGSLMTIDYIDLKENMTVKQCMDHIKDVGLDSETIYNCYVRDEKRHLIGAISLRSLVMAEETDRVSDLMHSEVMSISVFTDQEEVSNIFKRYGLLALPVVDK
ncbi:MAG: magnesium transporter, partial [Firmicutes bacterium]|nr:magnesium transporter [Bacillota bacterium]